MLLLIDGNVKVTSGNGENNVHVTLIVSFAITKVMVIFDTAMWKVIR